MLMFFFYYLQQWRAVENIQVDTSGWIPDYNTAQQVQPQLPKLRRLRKRKRRPQVVSLTGDTDLAENNYPVRRIKRPQHLHEEGQHLWTQMEEDSRIKPNNRRRITPSFNDNNQGQLEINMGDQISVFQADEAVSDDTKSTSNSKGIPYLKTILKQAGGLSLSEILQQKNLSLSDLLKGEKEAILAITEKPDNPVITEYKNPVEDDYPKKNKYSSSYRFTSTRSPYISTTESSTHIVHTERRTYEGSTRISVKPNNVIVVDFKPSLIGLDAFRKQSDMFDSVNKPTTTARTSVDLMPKVMHKLPITSAKLHKISKSTEKPMTENEVYLTTLPPKAYKININELFGLSAVQQKPNNDEGPLRMSLDLNSVLEKNVESSVTASPESTTWEAVPEKLKTITAKDEITEILKDEETKSFLKKILELRNMSFEDLVELRERGSSQKHLADLFQNKTLEPDLKNGQSSNSSVKTETQNRDHITLLKDEKAIPNKLQLERQPKSSHFPVAFDSDGDRYIASVEPIEESNESKSIEETKDREKYTVTSFPTYKIELDKKFKEKPAAPISETWKSNYPDVFNDFYKRTHQKGIVEDLNEGYFDELKTIDEVENTVAESGNQKLSVEASKEIYEDTNDVFIKLPYGVKHAIFASLLIIGISLVIFLTILMIFKWSQKHKKRLCYNRSFSCSKIKSPILPGGSDRRSFRTFMSETLGRRKRYYKQHLQSVSDAIWENDRKPFQ